MSLSKKNHRIVLKEIMSLFLQEVQACVIDFRSSLERAKYASSTLLTFFKLKSCSTSGPQRQNLCSRVDFCCLHCDIFPYPC